MSWPRMPSRFDKAVSFTVAADRDQADRWGAAAVERCMEVASWLADTADAHLRERARTGQAPPLFWFRDRFLVTVMDTTRRPEIVSEVSVPGFLSYGSAARRSGLLRNVPSARTSSA
jgi:hypothetical protein